MQQGYVNYSNQPGKRPNRRFRYAWLISVGVVLLLSAGIIFLAPGVKEALFGSPGQQQPGTTTQQSSGGAGSSTAPADTEPASPAEDLYQSAVKNLSGGHLYPAAKEFRTLLDKYGDGLDEETRKASLDGLQQFYDSTVAEASQLISDNQFEKAALLAKQASELYPDDARVKNLLFSTENIVPYTGTVEHIFFHPLIAYPERAFPKSGRYTGQDLFMVTIPEFNEVIRQLYEQNYILIDINSLYEAQFDEQGGVIGITPRELMLPEGKKPVIISIDDINYYEYMIKDGQVFKLILNEENEVVTYSVDMEGKEVISKENEIVPILDTFVEEHPDFSMNNAKGTLAVTGYEGVLGYRINDWPKLVDNYEEELAGVKKVIARLKETGWNFASHSQGHRHTAAIAYDLLKEDTDRWEQIVRPVVGDTSVYIYPFGERVEIDDPKFAYLQKNGFAFFCGVGIKPYMKWYDTSALQMRRNIDGISLNGKGLSDMFDVSKILDPTRPPLSSR